MSKIDEAEKLLGSMTPGEEAQLLQRVARDLGDAFPGIDDTPGTCGGSTCIARTRIAVWILEQARRQGATEVDLLRSYPSLRAEDLANAWAYVRTHRDEIEREIAENEAARVVDLVDGSVLNVTKTFNVTQVVAVRGGP